MWSAVSSRGFLPGERFEWFSDLTSREVIPTALSTDRPADFEAEAAVLELGDVRVAKFAFSPLRSRRTLALIRRGDPEQYQLALMHAGTASISQHRNECSVGAGDFALWDTSRPYQADLLNSAGSVGLLTLQLPRSILPLPAKHIDRLLACPIPSEGSTAVLAAFLRSLEAHAAQCSQRELRRLGSIAVDLLASSLAQGLDVEEQLPAEVRVRALLRRIHTFIDDHLGDQDLTPAAVASSHNISVRTLHQLFQGTGETVQALIRRRRLERCRADLLKTGHLAHPVAVIAARWGFSGPAVFSRSFREAYGTSPTDFRALSVKEARAGCIVR
ncbi:AraC-like ligand-binding domain-containing protein [Streptomyces gardneri]|uniref:AraC-like ligand-binding domain-containing protein n=1 Tax=Streptomyces gardneri TaxID=66892 RepID=UPI00367B9705